MEPQASSLAGSKPTLAERLDALRDDQADCVLRVSDGRLDGELRVVQGEIITASFGKMRGSLAVHALLATGAAVTYEVLPAAANEQTGQTSQARHSMVVPRAANEESRTREPDESVVLPIRKGSVQAEPSAARQPPAHGAEPASAVPEAADAESVPAGTFAAAEVEARLPDPSAHAEPAAAPELARPNQLALPDPMHDPGASSFDANEFMSARGKSSRRSKRGGFPNVALMTLVYAGLLIAALLWWLQPPRVAPKPQLASAPVDRPVKLEAATAPAAVAGALVPTIVVRLLVSADGQVKQAEVQSRRDGLAVLEKQALEAARSYRFQPALQAGKPVAAWITLPVRFAPTPAPAREIVVKGSDTIGAALMPAWADALQRTEPQLKVQIESLGSSTGIAGLLSGSADVAASSRLIHVDELAFAEKLGIQLREVIAGYDGIAVIVHPNNPVQSLDVETVARIFAQRITSWSDLGGANAAIRVLGRPSYSGTHGFFKERMLARLGPDASFGPKVTSAETTKEIINAVANDVNAIGYASLGHVTPEVRALSLAPIAGAPPVAPAAAAIRDGSYPGARPLLLYLRADSGHDARALVDFALSAAGQALVEKLGFIALPANPTSALVSETAAPVVARPELIRIYFQPASAAVSPDSKLDLMAAAAALHAHHSALVIGNADSSGKLENNQRLARQRAEVVAARLKRFASRDASITIDVAAADHPLATNNTSDGRSANRRVDVIVLNR